MKNQQKKESQTRSDQEDRRPVQIQVVCRTHNMPLEIFVLLKGGRIVTKVLDPEKSTDWIEIIPPKGFRVG